MVAPARTPPRTPARTALPADGRPLNMLVMIQDIASAFADGERCRLRQLRPARRVASLVKHDGMTQRQALAHLKFLGLPPRKAPRKKGGAR